MSEEIKQSDRAAELAAIRRRAEMDIYEARAITQQTIVLSAYADEWKRPMAFLHEEIAQLIMRESAQALSDRRTLLARLDDKKD